MDKEECIDYALDTGDVWFYGDTSPYVSEEVDEPTVVLWYAV